MAGLFLFGSIGFMAGHFTGAPVGAVAAPVSQVTPSGTEMAPGFPEIAKAVRPAVVNITPAKTLVRQPRDHKGREGRNPMDQMEEFFGFDFPRQFGPKRHGQDRDPFERGPHRGGMGSGVIISDDGYVITNNHVVDGAKEVQVTLPDKREFTGKIVGADPKTDLAVVKIDAKGLPFVAWGDSSKLQVGEYVLAVGNPFGLNSTVTLGIVSALGRANVGITQYEDFIQTDAAINPGNSGGALINGRGELIGINTAIFSQSGGYQGIGFAVPSNLVRRVVDDLKQFGRVRRGSIGYVEVIPLTGRLADELRAPKTNGVVVNQMSRDSAAYRNGLEPGDIVLSVNGTTIADPSQFVRLIADTSVGSTARVEILRDGRRQTLRIPIEAQQARRVRR
jgi:serine protease Do